VLTTDPLEVARILDDAAHGRFPPSDGTIRVVAPPRGRADAVLAFTAHVVVAAPVEEADVEARVGGDLSAPMSPRFLTWLSGSLGTVSGAQDVLFAALATGTGDERLVRVEPDLDHPRIARAARYRDDLRAYEPSDGGAVVVVGRGLARRWEVAFEVDAERRGRGLGTRLASAARALLPEGTPVFVQVAPGNAASVRVALAAGFTPIGSEVLLPRA
jgi:GNAT superfamily N-acetyltransferase